MLSHVLGVVLLAQAPEASTTTDLALLIHSKNEIKDLERAEVLKILKAERRYWNGQRRIELLLPKSGSPEKDFLLEKVYEMSEAELKRHWIELVYQNKIPAPPRVMPSPAVAQALVGKQEGALAFVLDAERSGAASLKVLSVDGKKPGETGYWAKLEKGNENAPVSEVQVRAAGRKDDEDLAARVAFLEQEFAEQLSSESEGYDLGSLHLQGFGDVTLGASRTDAGDGSGQFALGQVDLYLTARIADRIHTLSEIVFETNDEGETVTDLERLAISYEFGDAATLRVGRLHTSLGWWNTTFHHGEWLQTTIERPRVIEFEDDGGVLPVHMVGVSLELLAPTRVGDVKLELQLGNGRGPTPDPPQAAGDANDAKSVNVQANFRPQAMDELLLGAGVYLDDIPENDDAGAGSVHGDLDEQIFNVFAVLETSRSRIASELFLIEHDGSGGVARSHGGYLQAERKFGSWRPYVRYELLEIDDEEVYFSDTADRSQLAVGVRWDLTTWNALKLQIERENPQGAEDSTALVLQSAFAF